MGRHECPACGLSAYWDVNKQICHNPVCNRNEPSEKTNYMDEMVEEGVSAPVEQPNILDRSWLWLDGKKTTIGVGASAIGEILALVGVPQGKILSLFGQSVAYGGITHKGLKKLNGITSGDSINWREVFNLVIDLIRKYVLKKE